MFNITTDSILSQIEDTSILNIGIVASPEPIETTLSGVTPGRALYDTPSPGTQTEVLPRSSRSRSRTKRAKGGFDAELAASRQRSSRSKRTRARNRSEAYSTYRQDKAHEAKARRSKPSQHDPQSNTESEPEDGGQPRSKSPTPAGQFEGQPSREQLEARISRKFQRIIDNSDTQALLDVDYTISNDPAYTTQTEEHHPEARFLSPVAVGVGGGFHLDHPAHRPGNKKTYQRLKGQRNPPPRYRSEIEISSDHETEMDIDRETEMDIDQPIIPPHQSRLAPHLPPQPIHDPESPFYSSTRTPFLGYPTDQSPQPPHHSPRPQAPSEPNNPAPYGIPTSSQSLGDPIVPPTHVQGHSPFAAPGKNLQLRAEGSVTSVPANSQSLGNPVPPPPPNAREDPHPPGSQRSDRVSTQQSASQSRRRPPSSLPRPSPLPTSAARGRKRPAGAKAYGTRLNIIEINSRRPPTSSRGRESLRRPPASSSTRRRANHTPNPQAQSYSQRRSTRNPEPPHPLSQEVDYADEPDLLETFDEDEHVAEFAAQGVVLNSGKPTVNDLHGVDRVLWKPTRDVAWGVAIGLGNFQARTVFWTLAQASYAKTLQQKYPHLAPRPMSETFGTVVVNSFSNCRYQDLLRIRESVKDHCNLRNPSTEQERQEIEQKIDKLYPNAVHHRDPKDLIDPYEGAIMPRTLADTFFYGPTAIGATYPGLFEKTDSVKDERKHLAILAYLATMIQFCLSEWKTGYFKKGKLNSNYLLSVFICHYDGLKAVTSRARDRLKRSYNEWFEAALASSQAPVSFRTKPYIQPVIRPEDVRPDSPRHSPAPADTTETGAATPGPSRLPAGILPTTPPSPGPSRTLGRPSPIDRGSRRYSPLASRPTPVPESPLHYSHVRRPTPHHSPSGRSLIPDAPYIAPFGSPRPGESALGLSLHQNPTPTPERDAEGRFTTRAKAKGRAID